MTSPSAGPLTLTQLPLFPLHTVLFPGGVLPLKIFEVRYLDMIGRCQQLGAPFGVVTLTEGEEVRRRAPSAQGAEPGFVREGFHPVGVLARIEKLEKPQAGLYLVQCRGLQRFHINRREQLPHGLWTADVTLDPPEPNLPVPDHLLPARQTLERVVEGLAQQGTPDTHPVPTPHQWDDCAWLANRWAELLPLPLEMKYRLMSLDSPVLRLELVADLLDRMGLQD
ncbi:LON peptidase substrate-binding domain-containing protein [Hydrogenophaga sp.]|uniref:LON peptidase substrate-binding domain-containing protein n=1 Tax=Hydrogenophaga sp. TaxID=1904254 RepID=UPI003918A86A